MQYESYHISNNIVRILKQEVRDPVPFARASDKMSTIESAFPISALLSSAWLPYVKGRAKAGCPACGLAVTRDAPGQRAPWLTAAYIPCYLEPGRRLSMGGGPGIPMPCGALRNVAFVRLGGNIVSALGEPRVTRLGCREHS
jgi:hypothetical protein